MDDALTHGERGVLRWVTDLSEPASLELSISLREPPEFRVLPRFSDRDLDQALELLAAEGFIAGDRGEGDGSQSWWSDLRVTASGLVELGEWGTQDAQSLWRRRDSEVLARLFEDPAPELLSTQPLSDAPSTVVPGVTEGDMHRSLILLADGGLIDAERYEQDLFGSIRVTLEGRRALEERAAADLSRTVPVTDGRYSVEAAGQRAWALGMAEALCPLEEGEMRIVTRYVDRAGELADSSLVQTGARLGWSASKTGMQTEVEYAGDEAVRAALLLFRALYRDDEPASFKRTLAILRARAVALGGPSSEALTELLDEVGRGYRKLLRSADPMLVLSDSSTNGEPPRRTRQVIEDWLNGEHFHWDSDRAKRLSEHEPPELLLFSFLSAIMQASAAYDALAEVGVAALELSRRSR